LALFVALGGSAYAAATINSASVVDNSLTGADVRGRAASKGKPFTQGTLTRDDIKDGSVTGADIFDNSLGGADVLEGSLGKVPNADRLDGLDSSNFVQTSQQAGDAAKLGGKDPSAYGVAVYTNSQRSEDCVANVAVPADSECARITVGVPAGRVYRAVVWSSVTAVPSDTVFSCPAWKTESMTRSQCLTPARASTSSQGAGFLTSAAANSPPVSLGSGKYSFSTFVGRNIGQSFTSNARANATTTVMITDTAVPAPPSEVCRGVPPNCNTSGGSSGTSG
ncbi:MAG: hypothetical protein QOE86_78, partial [Solirubrobacteraceae bacterium]|nr:hypothetical protein [Solirubrobacteraceae bacterium]